ncbi:DUF5406 family protein [Mesorhizobium sp. SP-1A]|uniref:DUF5406 family protein n=1 Tax=Mesorhizobium sp. SP-1A TaxID=3077840 RepID=UPI0028F6D166|nr:DUF5406 family protein [Mesorhizobium sp. SP-1A]
MTAETTVINFDPNMNCSGNMSTKTIRMTFGVWDYRLIKEITVGGNGAGFHNIDSALMQLYEDVEETGIVLKRESDGETLLCEDDDDQGEDWLKDMLIAAEIIAIAPQEWPKD